MRDFFSDPQVLEKFKEVALNRNIGFQPAGKQNK